MLRALIIFLGLLHVAPALAFMVVAFGCDLTLSHSTGLCAGDTIKPFLLLTGCFFVLLGVPMLMSLSHSGRSRRA